MPSIQRVLSSEVPRDTIALARALLGMCLFTIDDGQLCGGRIVETEAYPLDDPASHAFRGMTPRCAAMFLDGWHLYVYRSYGIHYCVNITSEGIDEGAAVLIRAIEPEEGVSLMEQRRRTVDRRKLARGPGRLTEALGIGSTHNGDDLNTSSKILIARTELPPSIAVSRRIGITVARESPLRFFDPTSRYVSVHRRTEDPDCGDR